MMYILIEKLIIKQEFKWLCVYSFFLKFEKIILNVIVQFIHQNSIIYNVVLFLFKVLKSLLVWQNL